MATGVRSLVAVEKSFLSAVHQARKAHPWFKFITYQETKAMVLCYRQHRPQLRSVVEGMGFAYDSNIYDFIVKVDRAWEV
jgi:hypothetical protein